MEPIKGKIAEIIDNRKVVINRGKKHGISKDMLFSVRLNLPDIVDPDDESIKLTGIYYEKGRLKVGDVYENMSFASLEPKYTISNQDLAGASLAFARSLSYLHTTTTVYPEIDKSEALTSDSNWLIQKGDEIVQVEEEEKKENQKPNSQ